jgi:hypothetical protein
LLPRIRFPGNRLRDFEVRVELGEQRATLWPFPRDGERAVFDRGPVRIETDAGGVVSERDDPRASFFGLSGLRRNLRWDPLDVAYFAGYAIWNYLTTPYLLSWDRLDLREGPEWREGDESWRRLEVTFPSELHTHSAEQSFYVDERGLIRRHDYTAEPISRLAKATHYTDGHREFGGLVFPTRRRVRPRRPGGRALSGPILVSLDIIDVTVEAAS